MNHNLELGNKGEEIAVKHLKENGYEIIDRNWRASRTEIDIIAKHQKCTIFIEVKTRSNTKHGQPEEIVDEGKMKRIANTAEIYLEEKKIEGEIRFDIISIILNDVQQELNHIEDAFFPYD